MTGRPINVLLLLSAEQQPSPDDEIVALDKLARQSRSRSIYFATTRRINGLTAGESTVALYGDGSLDFDLLASGKFGEFVEKDSDQWSDIMDSHPLYDYGNIPETACGFVRIDQFEKQNLIPIDNLGGIVESGEALSYELVQGFAEASREGRPFGLEKSSIYFVAATEEEGPLTSQEATALVRAKVNELHHKIWQFSEFWYDVESALSKSREAITELKEGKRLAETALAHSSGSNMDPPRAGRGQKLRRFERMIESNFPKIRFCGSSLETLIEYYSANDVSWKILGDLNRIGKANKLDARDLKAFKGTKNWVEAKLAGSRRIYYRSAPSGETRVWVLVSRRSLQGGPDTHFMKKHDRA